MVDSKVKPNAINIRTPTTASLCWNDRVCERIYIPNPSKEIKNSAITAPTKALPAANRNPATKIRQRRKNSYVKPNMIGLGTVGAANLYIFRWDRSRTVARAHGT